MCAVTAPGAQELTVRPTARAAVSAARYAAGVLGDGPEVAHVRFSGGAQAPASRVARAMCAAVPTAMLMSMCRRPQVQPDGDRDSAERQRGR
jgi:hypothetical protein